MSIGLFSLSMPPARSRSDSLACTINDCRLAWDDLGGSDILHSGIREKYLMLLNGMNFSVITQHRQQ
jgi:hypothetical protein